jgi:DNA modification methylase
MSVLVEFGDCLDVMSRMPGGSVDAVITDPPYCSGAVGEAARTAAKGQGLRSGVRKEFGWFVGDNMTTAGLVFLLRSVAYESLRLLKPGGSFLCFCDWRMVPNLAPAIESSGLRYQNMIVWDKGHFGLGAGFRPQHEIVLHFTAGAPDYHNKATSNVIKCARVHHSERVHQTEKPVDLMERLIDVVCPPGGLVLDPFGGSGTTGVAARNLGRRAVLIERDIANVETAWCRVTA